MMTWDQALLWIAGICTAILTIGSVLGKMLSPLKMLEDRVSKLEGMVDDNVQHLDADMISLQKQEQVNSLLLESMVLLLEHEATGNHNADMTVMAGKLKGFIFDQSSKLK